MTLPVRPSRRRSPLRSVTGPRARPPNPASPARRPRSERYADPTGRSRPRAWSVSKKKQKKKLKSSVVILSSPRPSVADPQITPGYTLRRTVPHSVEQGHSPPGARVRGLRRHRRDISKSVRQKADELSDFGDRHANRTSADIVVPGADYELPGLWVPSRPEVQTVPSSVLDEQATPGCELRHGHSMNPPDSDVECASDSSANRYSSVARQTGGGLGSNALAAPIGWGPPRATCAEVSGLGLESRHPGPRSGAHVALGTPIGRSASAGHGMHAVWPTTSSPSSPAPIRVLQSLDEEMATSSPLARISSCHVSLQYRSNASITSACSFSGTASTTRWTSLVPVRQSESSVVSVRWPASCGATSATYASTNSRMSRRAFSWRSLRPPCSPWIGATESSGMSSQPDHSSPPESESPHPPTMTARASATTPAWFRTAQDCPIQAIYAAPRQPPRMPAPCSGCQRCHRYRTTRRPSRQIW